MIKHFNNEKLDVTCDTALKYHLFAKAKRSSEFFVKKEPLLMLLASGKDFANIPTKVIKSLWSFINQKTLAKTLKGVPRTFYSYIDAYPHIYQNNIKNIYTNIPPFEAFP